MEIYTLKANYEKNLIIDKFDSMIWTERYDDLGDFQIKLPNTPQNRLAFPEETLVTHSETDRLMVVETITDETDAEGRTHLTVSGKSFESFLKNRVVTPSNAVGTTWRATGKPGYLAARLVGQICVDGSGLGGQYDVIPEMYMADTTPDEPDIYISVKLDTLFNGLQSLCRAFGYGFRVQLLDTTPRLRFNIFKGRDLRYVVLAASLDSLAEEKHMRSVENYRNTAYVWGKDGLKNIITAPPGGSVYRSGRDRRVLYVDASDIDPTGLTTAQYEAELRQRGREELAEHNRTDIFDAKLTGADPYVYRLSYSLGDTITLMDQSNKKYDVIITEFVWTWDAQGLRGFPTFANAVEWNV